MMDIVSLEMENLIYEEIEAKYGNFLPALQQMEELVFEDGFYKNGPTMIEMKPTEFEDEQQHFKFYIPTNEPVSNGTSEIVEELKIAKALHKCVPFDIELDADLNEMKTYLKDEGLAYADRLLLVFTLVYQEYWVDLLIPIEED